MHPRPALRTPRSPPLAVKAEVVGLQGQPQLHGCHRRVQLLGVGEAPLQTRAEVRSELSMTGAASCAATAAAPPAPAWPLSSSLPEFISRTSEASSRSSSSLDSLSSIPRRTALPFSPPVAPTRLLESFFRRFTPLRPSSPFNWNQSLKVPGVEVPGTEGLPRKFCFGILREESHATARPLCCEAGTSLFTRTPVESWEPSELQRTSKLPQFVPSLFCKQSTLTYRLTRPLLYTS